jgi:DNA-binding response OmpR family regulator
MNKSLGATLRILVIEDDPQAAGYLVRGLRESGHIVDAAGDGVHGLDLALENLYDALVVDRRLPGLDGLELVRRLRAAGSDTPAAACSARACRSATCNWTARAAWPSARGTASRCSSASS